MSFLIKVLTSALLIGLITEVSKKWPVYGGIIASLPIVSIFSLIILNVQGQTESQVNLFLINVLIGLPGTFILLITIYYASLHEIPFIFSLAIGAISWMLFFWIQHWIMNIINLN